MEKKICCIYFYLDAGRKYGKPASALEDDHDSRMVAQSSNNSIPLFDNLNQQDSRTAKADNHPSASRDDLIFASER